jgi:hypothetical protein
MKIPITQTDRQTDRQYYNSSWPFRILLYPQCSKHCILQTPARFAAVTCTAHVCVSQVSQHTFACHNTRLCVTTHVCVSQHTCAFSNRRMLVTTYACMSQHMYACHNICMHVATHVCMAQPTFACQFHLGWHIVYHV